MHVAIDGSPLGAGQGGDETFLRGLIGALAESVDPCEGHRFTLHLRDGQPAPAEIVDHPDFPVRRLGTVSTPVRLARTLPAGLRGLTPRPDVVYSTVHAPVRSPIPVALQVHDLSFLHHPELFTARTRLRLRVLIDHQIRRAGVVCTISEFSRQDIIEAYALAPDRVHVIPPALPSIRPQARGRRRESLDQWLDDVGVRPPYVLSVGNLHPRKNVTRLIEAFVSSQLRSQAARDHQLVVCGQRRWGDDTEGRAAAAARPGTVVFAGRVSDEQRDHLLRRATLLAYPSLFEGFGLPPLEAMSVGVPVLASTRAAIPEVVGDAALLVEPTDTDGMADAIAAICEDSRLREDLVRAGHERARSFGPARTTSAALRAFDTAVIARRGRAPRRLTRSA